ncbi:ankyrin repeat-containing domain protein [Aspergillus venezuelensis]
MRLVNGNFSSWFLPWLWQLEKVSEVLTWNDGFKDRVLQVLSSPDTSCFAARAFVFTEVVTWYRDGRPDMINAKNNMGATGLHLACQYGHQAVLEELLDARADIDAKDRFVETALIRAFSAEEEEIMKTLLQRGANARIQDRRIGTALQAAALHGHVAIVRHLVRYRADVEAEGGHFGTALQAASMHGHIQVVKELLAMGALAKCTRW